MFQKKKFPKTSEKITSINFIVYKKLSHQVDWIAFIALHQLQLLMCREPMVRSFNTFFSKASRFNRASEFSREKQPLTDVLATFLV